MYTRIATVLTFVILFGAYNPSQAQDEGIEYFPLIGYDIDWEGLTIGFGAAFPVNFDFLPVDESRIRPSAEYILVGDQGTQANLSVFRIAGELIGSFYLDGDSAMRFGGPYQDSGTNIVPFAKAGVAFERFSFEWDEDVPFVGGQSVSNSELGLVLGGGARFNKFFGEGTLGIGNISSFRIAAGYVFGG